MLADSSKSGSVPTATTPARHAANTSSIDACPRAFTAATTGVDEEISGAKPGTTLGTRSVTDDAAAGLRRRRAGAHRRRERGERGAAAAGRPAPARAPARDADSAAVSAQPAITACHAHEEHERQRGHERDHLDARLRALSMHLP